MARQPRMKVHGKQGNYHIVSRVRGRDFLLDDHMKKYFISTLKRLKELFYVRYIAFCPLENHYHLLLGCESPDSVDPQEAIERWNRYHKPVYRLNENLTEDRDYAVAELTDISSYMKRLNMHLTREYNRHADAQGTLWERRFRSTIVSRGWATVKTAAYIDLNSFRASLTPRPEEYPYSSLNHLKRGNALGLLDMEEIEHGIKRSRLYAQQGNVRHNGLQGQERTNPSQSTKSAQKHQEIYETYVAVVYRLGTTPHRNEHGIPEKDGIVITEQMKKNLAAHGITEQAAAQGSFRKRIQEYTMGKFVGASERDARKFYAEHMSEKSSASGPGRSEEGEDTRKGTGLEQWIKKIGPGQWCVCSSRGSSGRSESTENSKETKTGRNNKSSYPKKGDPD